MIAADASLDDLRLLVEVVATGGLTAAAARLGLRKSTVSRRLAALEERLGVRLLERNARRLRLTEAGRAYHARAARLVAEARALDRETAEARGAPQGTLRIATPALLGELLAPAVAELLLRHPRLSVEVALAPPHVDLLAEEHDLALRTGPLADSSLVARRLGTLRTGCYASPAYLARRGTPATADALRGEGDAGAHDCILLAEAGTDEVWFFGAGATARTVRPAGRLRVPSVRAGQLAARAGLGVVRLPAALVAEDVRSGRLVAVLEAETPPGMPVHAVYPSGRHLAPKVRAFLELVSGGAAALPWDPPGRAPAEGPGAAVERSVPARAVAPARRRG
ncbi:LysR family transcriptional regulator [Anaeromyxobacter dehalogenans]|uniref:Transcriptional regulator, LysR family n=1 Tax=Anaeromyxobacter dehalogenans (strain 2CP-C) TaxID=290397 RepID=Q2IJZ3_ANADE|nr:LysR family transcriptional regulator [Anaeromyxobacter dehalogenans]ABC81972.1 transcriptional regulator, LysR family [Anaeromyxobacter dehalogenans 2CP-C]